MGGKKPSSCSQISYWELSFPTGIQIVADPNVSLFSPRGMTFADLFHHFPVLGLACAHPSSLDKGVQKIVHIHLR